LEDILLKQPDLYSEINKSKGIKRLIKKIIFKLTSWLVESGLEYSKAQNEVLVKIINDNRQVYEKIHNEKIQEINQLINKNEEINKNLDEANKKIADFNRRAGAISRDIIRTKWRYKDYILSLTNNSERDIECGICKYKNKVKNFETIETDCIFEGGHLVRYICPECGVIFGPLKFSDQNEAEFNDDYTVHYSGFSEGDSTEKEIMNFKLLNPSKDKIYLNYGCGCWSHSLKKLHEDGYTVYGYEPYSPDFNNKYLITDKNILINMRFDGIFSNDLLEHLQDPIKELIFMKSLLKNSSAKMAHSTGCYKYLNEYTRFHMYFFTGRSLDVICDKADLSHSDLIESKDFPDYLCYLFTVKDET